MKATDLLRDPKAWLYFLAAALGALAASQTFGWRAVCAALSTGFLAVKAYTSPNQAGVPASALKEPLPPAEPATPPLPPEVKQ